LYVEEEHIIVKESYTLLPHQSAEAERWAELADAILIAPDRAAAAATLGIKVSSLTHRLCAYRKRKGWGEYLQARRSELALEKVRLREGNLIAKERLMGRWLAGDDSEEQRLAVTELNRLEPQQIEVQQDVRTVQREEVVLSDEQYNDLERALGAAEQLAAGETGAAPPVSDDPSYWVRPSLPTDEQTGR
jgi:hypothetical protein